MAIKQRLIKGASGSETRQAGDATFQIEAYDDAYTEPVATATPAQRITALESYVNSLYTAVATGLPTTFRGLWLGSIDWSETDEFGRILFTGKYSITTPEATRRWSFDTTGGSIKITTSRNTSRFPGTAPNFNGAIEVKNNEPQGVDITVPALKLTCTYRHAAASTVVNASTIDAYVKTLATLSGTVNNATWLTYAAGELLFLGATGEYVPNRPTEIQYHFAASANVTGLSIGSISGIAKKGHEYLWVLFEPSADSGAGNALVQRPLAAYVERVYTETDFNGLGIHV
jgi:hypothetical protein